MKLTTIILMRTRFDFKKVCYSLGNNYTFMKTIKIHYVLKGIDENPYTRIRKRGSQQNATQFGTYSFSLHLHEIMCKMCTEPKRGGGYAVHLAQQ